MDLDGDFSWLGLTSECVAELEQELATFERKSIDELRRLRWLKHIPVREMTVDAQRRLRAISAELEGLWQLHLSRHRWRVWGWFEDPMFYVVWWDPNHNVCTGNSRKRRAE